MLHQGEIRLFHFLDYAAAVEDLERMGRGGYLFPVRVVVEVPEGSNVSKALMQYMASSEQVASMIAVCCAMDGDEVVRFLCGLDVFAFASRGESFGIAVLVSFAIADPAAAITFRNSTKEPGQPCTRSSGSGDGPTPGTCR